MASEQTLYSSDGDWKVDFEAWKNYFWFYSSIGSQVSVYHRETTRNIWGNEVTDWVAKPASRIHIKNVYSGSGPRTITKTKSNSGESSCQLKEWAVGISITLPLGGPTDIGGNATLSIDKVDADISVTIVGGETLRASVSASSAFSDHSIW